MRLSFVKAEFPSDARIVHYPLEDRIGSLEGRYLTGNFTPELFWVSSCKPYREEQIYVWEWASTYTRTRRRAEAEKGIGKIWTLRGKPVSRISNRYKATSVTPLSSRSAMARIELGIYPFGLGP